ncbi:MAG: malto-oligosyltrehalose synthase [Thermodesulfobacteriota bacterium]
MISAPRATYRVQFRPGFGFAECRAVLPYLAELGVSHIYASPIFKARPGSDHGYDVCDHHALNPELGPPEEFDTLMADAARLGMGWVQDIVPNHMAVSGDNRMLVDVLENGQDSRYISFFDIEWDHPYKSMKGRMLAPFLGSYYSQALENGEIRLGLDDDGFHVRYYDIRFPLRVDSYATILTHGIEVLREKLGPENPEYVKLLGLLYNIKAIVGEKRVQERYEQIFFIKRMLYEMHNTDEVMREHIDGAIRVFNGVDGEAEGDRYALLDCLLAEQHFRLSYWKVAGEEINYRRFFSINNLISLRVEDEAVFHHTHKLILEFIRQKRFTGLRVDHIDGLYDPSSYLQRLRAYAPDAYIVVEKILVGDETLPAFWPVQGTTGYDFMNLCCGLFVDQGQEASFTRIYEAASGEKRTLAEMTALKKREMINRHMAGDVDNLARLVNTVSSKDRKGFDITMASLRRAIGELFIQFPVYRTYISAKAFRPEDLGYVRAAVRATRRANPDLGFELEFLERFMLLEFDERMEEADRKEWLHFVMRFQQATGPLMAKALEDSAFYVMNRLVCLNEVGGDPSRFGVTAARAHEELARRRENWPLSMNATATHDTKRGEDARMRLAALSGIPEDWAVALREFRKAARGRKRRVGGRSVPDRNEEYFLYQTLLGASPFPGPDGDTFPERLGDYVVKALREAKEHSNWITPDAQYEDACREFALGLARQEVDGPFRKRFEPLLGRVARLGAVNSLSQTLLKIAAPGVPDFYQGTELWDFSMVDPDNRRPVDFAFRMKMLQGVKRSCAGEGCKAARDLLEKFEDGRIKMFLIWKALAARRDLAPLFEEGSYEPLEFKGARGDMAFGFARVLEGRAALAVVPRLFARAAGEEARFPLDDFWEDTEISWAGSTPLRDVFTGKTFPQQRLMLREVFGTLPFALLVPGE